MALRSLRQQMDVRFCSEQEPTAERQRAQPQLRIGLATRSPEREQKTRVFQLTQTYMDAGDPGAQCVIAIPALELAPKVVAIGNCSGRDVDKFKRFGLTPVLAEQVAPPLVAECFANLAVSLLKRWLLETHQGGVSLEHLDSYLDEFTFRFNRRKSRSGGKLFYRLMEQAVAVEPAPYKSLVRCSVKPDF